VLCTTSHEFKISSKNSNKNDSRNICWGKLIQIIAGESKNCDRC
jgi:hypothetical protein